jgi:uncharacterized protein YyaL (SSP411 family)
MNLGGFGGAPKFPPASALEFLLARGEEDAVKVTLDAMASGGIHDQIGGGFARYSVDASWLVPHFEKMLYDNALLARAYLHGWQAHGYGRWRLVAEQTLDWMLAEMRGPEGGFYSAFDADSEGEEGRFYVWNLDEITAILGEAGLAEDAPEILRYWGVSEAGNFEGRNILYQALGAGAPEPQSLAAARRALYDARARRVWPGLDDKRLASWNALAIAALADAGAVLGRDDYLQAAVAGAEFIEARLRDADGRLLRSWKDGEGKIAAFLEDHAYLLDAYLVLYEATFDERWFRAARTTADTMIERFADPERGGFFTTAADGERLIVRRKDVDDHPIPSGNSAAAYALLRLAALTGESRYSDHAVSVLRLFGRVAEQHPQAVAHLLRAIDFHRAAVKEVAIVTPAGADGDRSLADVVRAKLRPYVVLAGGEEGTAAPELMRDRTTVDGSPAAYVCENFACRQPVTSAEELEAALG